MKRILFAITISLAVFTISCNSDSSDTDTTTETAPMNNETTTTVTPEVNTTTPVTTEMATALTAMSVDRTEHDFGKIPDTAPVETKFVITNTGDEPLLITNAQGSCGCTVPEYPKDPIPPGESRDMKVSFNPSGKVGVNNKTVTITANTDPAQTIIYVKSDVIQSAQ